MREEGRIGEVREVAAGRIISLGHKFRWYSVWFRKSHCGISSGRVIRSHVDFQRILLAPVLGTYSMGQV